MGSCTLAPAVAAPPLLNLKMSGRLLVVTGGNSAAGSPWGRRGAPCCATAAGTFSNFPPRAGRRRTTLLYTK